jgi:hypothetical protein
LSFAEERIGPLAAIVTTVFYLLALYLLVLPNTPEDLFASIYSDSLIKTAHQHLLLLVGFDTLIYRQYYDTPPILVGHHLVKWKRICTSNNKGGLNVKDLIEQNIFLLIKWWWKLQNQYGSWQKKVKPK